MNDSEAIELTFDNSLSEHIHAIRAYDARGAMHKVSRIVAGLLLAFGIWCIYAAGVRWWTVIWFPLAVVEWFDLLSIRPLQVFAAFRANPKYRERYDVRFSDDGIHFRTSTIDSRLAWSHYQQLMETDKVFLLIYGPSMYSIIPKRAFMGTEELDRFRSLVRRKIGENRQ